MGIMQRLSRIITSIFLAINSLRELANRLSTVYGSKEGNASHPAAVGDLEQDLVGLDSPVRSALNNLAFFGSPEDGEMNGLGWSCHVEQAVAVAAAAAAAVVAAIEDASLNEFACSIESRSDVCPNEMNSRCIYGMSVQDPRLG
jgi:hypothetical protein